VASGHIEQTDGSVIDTDLIEQRILEDCARFNVQAVHYDPWNAKRLVAKLEAAGITMEPFIQGPKSYHPAMQEFERAYMSGNFAHGGDPVLTWCASNLVTRTDENMNNAPNKKKSPDKIDDMVAMLMAFAGWVGQVVDDDISDFINSPVIG
jgi:phage terminase large subunit-like protein